MLKRLFLVLFALALFAAAAVYWIFSGEGVRLALERQATAWLGQRVRIGSATAQIVPLVAIQLGDVRIGEPVRLTLDDVEVSTGLRALLSRRVEDAELIVSDSRIDLPLPFAIPDSADGESPAEGAGGITVVSIRTITLRNVRIASRGREIAVSARSSLTGSRLDLSRFTATAGGTSLEASGVVELEPRLDAKLEAAANQLDLDDLLALADAFTPPQRNAGPLVAGRISANLSAAKGRAAGVDLTKLSGNLLVEGDRVQLSPASFELFDGRYEGALDVDLRRDLSVSLTSRIADLDVARLTAFGGVPDTISGRLSGSGRFSGRGADMAAVLAAASGIGSATITDGTIKRLDLVRTVILFFGKPVAEAKAQSSERFDRINASFSLARQVVRADTMTLLSRDVDMTGAGTLTIPTKALDGRANLLLSEELSAQAGRDLIRYTREGNRVVLPATLGGTLEEPRVMIDATAAITRGLRNEVQRQLKGLFERIKPAPKQ